MLVFMKWGIIILMYYTPPSQTMNYWNTLDMSAHITCRYLCQ